METVQEIYHAHSNSEYDRIEEGECCDEEEESSSRRLARRLLFTDETMEEDMSSMSKRSPDAGGRVYMDKEKESSMDSPYSESKGSARYEDEVKRDRNLTAAYVEEEKGYDSQRNSVTGSPTQTPRSVEHSVAIDSADKIIHRAMHIAVREIEAK
jgi:hypothetical protein